MARFLLKSCCACTSLRSGSFITAYFLLFLNVSNIWAHLVALIGEVVMLSSEISQPSPDDDNAVKIVLLMVLTLLASMQLLVCLISTVVLLVGLYEMRRDFIQLYLVFGTVCLIVFFLFVVLMAFSGASAYKIIADVVFVALYVYFLLVVRSYYYQMEQPEEKPSAHADELTAAA